MRRMWTTRRIRTTCAESRMREMRETRMIPKTRAQDVDHARRAQDVDHARRARDARDPPDAHIARHRDRRAWGGEFWPPEIPLDPSQW